MRRFLFRVLRIAALSYLGLLLIGLFLSDRLIFPAHRASYHDDASILKLRTGDGETISAVYLPNPLARFTVLYSHGNGEDLGDDLPMLGEYQRHGFSIFAYDYHGYGTSTGRPSEPHAYDDIDTAYDYLTKKLGIPPGRIIVHGHSLGGGVAIDLASRKSCAGLIAESTFVTAFRVQTHWPLVPMDKFRSVDKIGAVRCPVLVIHGLNDGLIRPWQGRELFARAPEPKFSLWVEGAGHNDLIEVGGAKYWQTIADFAQFIDRNVR